MTYQLIPFGSPHVDYFCAPVQDDLDGPKYMWRLIRHEVHPTASQWSDRQFAKVVNLVLDTYGGFVPMCAVLEQEAPPCHLVVHQRFGCLN